MSSIINLKNKHKLKFYKIEEKIKFFKKTINLNKEKLYEFYKLYLI